MDKLRIGLATVAVLGIAVVGAGAWARSGGQEPGVGPDRGERVGTVRKSEAHRGEPARDTDPTSNSTAAPNSDERDRRATQLALGVHTQAASFDKLPRFSYRVRYRHGAVDSMRAIDVSLDRLKRALTDPVLTEDWVGWYETGFSWDEERFLSELETGAGQPELCPAVLDEGRRLGPARGDRPFRGRFRAYGGRGETLEAGDPVRLQLPGGDSHPTASGGARRRLTNSQAMSLTPPDKATWRHMGVEEFAGETCDIVDSSQRTERLWIGRDSGRVRGVLSY